MPAVQTPTNQLRINDPYQQRLFDFNTSDSRLYLARVSNQLLKTFGNDIVLNGFNFNSASHTNDTVSINIEPGLAIVDQTLIEVSDEVSLDLLVDGYETSGKIIIYLSYQWLHTVTENPLRIKISYVASDGEPVLPGGWIQDRDRVVLAIFDFEKNPSNIITNFSEITDEIKQVYIDSRDYYKFGYVGGKGQHKTLSTFLEYSGGLTGGEKEISKSATPPEDTDLYWLDISINPASFKHFNGSTWEFVGSAGGSSYSEPVIAPDRELIFNNDGDIVMTIVNY